MKEENTKSPPAVTLMDAQIHQEQNYTQENYINGRSTSTTSSTSI